MAISRGTKGAMLLFTLASVFMIAGFISLISGSSDVEEKASTERHDVDLEAVAKLYTKTVYKLDDLKTFADAVNKEADDLFTNSESFTKDKLPVQTQHLSDGTVVTFVDLDKNNMIHLYDDESGVPVEIPISSTPGDNEDSRLKVMAGQGAQDAKDLPRLSQEVLFLIRVSNEDDKTNLIVSDRHHQPYKHSLSSEEAKNEVHEQSRSYQRHYYGGYWHAPMFFMYHRPGYYGTWSSVRSRSLGSRWGSGGIGGGK